MKHWRMTALLGAVALLSACERSYIEGHVTDIHGAALPGVIVRMPNSTTQDLTDGLGNYRLAASGGPVHLAFSKTGYSSAELTVDASKRRGANASLWPLPLNAGIYVVSDLHFVSMTRVVPKEYDLKDGTKAFGTQLPDDVRDATSEPFIVAYRTPRYNARLSRLMSAEVQGSGGSAGMTVWVEAGTMAAALEPVDHPDGQLLQLQVGRALEPGVYGVHWGAMSGYTTLDTRVFLFRVPEPTATEPLEADNPPAAAKKATDESKGPDTKPADPKRLADTKKESEAAPAAADKDDTEKQKQVKPAAKPLEPIEEKPSNP